MHQELEPSSHIVAHCSACSNKHLDKHWPESERVSKREQARGENGDRCRQGWMVLSFHKAGTIGLRVR